MRKKSRILSLLVALCMCFTMIPATVFAEDVQQESGDQESLDNKIVLVYTSNVKGDVDVYQQAAALKAKYEDEGAEVILADTGNYLQGSVYANYDRGKTIVDLMDTAGYDVAGVGTREFYYGDATLGTSAHGDLTNNYTFKQLLYGYGRADGSLDKRYPAGFKAVATNVEGENDYFYFKKNQSVSRTYLDETSNKNATYKVGFIGLTDTSVTKKVLADNVDGLTFLSGNDMYTAAQTQATNLKDSKGCETVVCMDNTGAATESNSGADVVIDASDDATKIGAVAIDPEDGTTEELTVGDIDSSTAADEVKTAVSDAKTATASVEIATNEVTLTGDQTAVRSLETNTGDLWTDALVWYANQSGNAINTSITEKGVSAGNVVALWNGGNLRDYLQTGAVTKKDIERVLPYPNRVAVAYLTGAQLLETLETGTQGLPYSSATDSACAAFPQVSGIKYTVKSYIDYDKGDAYNESWYKAKSVKRVSIDSINGQEFDEDATYAVITSNAIFGGMDAYYTFEGKDADSKIDSKMKVTEAVWNYVKTELNGNIGDEYADAQDRITVIYPQTVSVKSTKISKTYGNAAFSLGAKSSVGAKLTYKSSNTAVAKVSSAGKVTIAGPGTAKITVSAAAQGQYGPASKTVTVTVGKAAQSITKAVSSKTVKYSKLKKKAQTFKIGAKAKGKVTYKKLSGNKKITVSKTGKVTVKKNLKKGTYKVKVKMSAASTKYYKAKTVTKTIKIKVK